MPTPDPTVNPFIANLSRGRALPRAFAALCLLSLTLAGTAAAQAALNCGTPGKDGALVVPAGGVVNTYYPMTASVAAGVTSLTLGTPRGNTGVGLTSGDLLLVIQMQDATINIANTGAYGDGVAGDPASGLTGGSAGQYEYVRVTSALAAGAAGSVNIAGSTGGGLLRAYTHGDADATQGARRFQVIRVPQYSTATLTSALTASPWNGATGGVLAFDVAGAANLGSATVNVSGLGFRGGGGRALTGGTTPAGGTAPTATDYRYPTDATLTATLGRHASKGEGVAGTPRYVNDSTTLSPSVVNTGSEGLPGGSNGMGAPGNAGGGGTDDGISNENNSGGGGGSNGGAGGRGGDGYYSGDTVTNPLTGGFGGAAFTQGSSSRLILGGGGGAGTSNNNFAGGQTPAHTSGARGGGIIMLRAASLTGSGALVANGNSAADYLGNDAAGGGGAGGTVLVYAASSSAALTINANGGNGGHADINTFTAPHGPGGGGGGGVVYNNVGASVTVNGGTNGRTPLAAATAFSVASGIEFGSTVGTPGMTGTVTAQPTDTGLTAGAACVPVLNVAKTTSTPTRERLAHATAAYTLTVQNAAGRVDAQNVSVTDPLPGGFTLVSATFTLAGGATRTTTSNPAAGATSPTWGTWTIPGGGSLTITFTVNLNGAATGTYQNGATATGSFSNSADNSVSGTYVATSSTAEDVTVTPPTTSACVRQGGTLGTNLFTNGNFGTTAGGPGTISAALPAERTTYTYTGTFPPNDGSYTIINRPASSGFNAWYIAPDHTTGTNSGNMMLVNADLTPKVFYQETLTVTPNTNYELSAWVINLIANNSPALPNISLEIDRAGMDDDNDPSTPDGSEGQTVLSTGSIANATEAIWKYYGLIINSGGATSVTARFRNNAPGGAGNDVAVDDLSFTPCTGLAVGAVSGTLYRDRNNNGTFETTAPVGQAVDSRIGAGVAVSLTDSVGGITVTVFTDANGNYSFTNVPAGTYRVWVATADPDLGGLTPRSPAGAQILNLAVTSGANVTGQNFGFNAPGLSLTKSVRNCGRIASGAACTTAFGSVADGKSGDVLEYRIEFLNPGAVAANSVVLSDLVPANTNVDLSGYAAGRGLSYTSGATTTTLTSASDADAGSVTASEVRLNVGTVAPGASGSMSFRTTIR